MNKQTERFNNIVEELMNIKVSRSHETKETYKPFVYDIIMKLDMVVGKDNHRYKINSDSDSYLTTSFVDENRIFVYNTKEDLFTFTKKHHEDDIKNGLLELLNDKTSIFRLFTNNLKKVPHVYKSNIRDWYIENNSKKEMTIEHKMVLHLTNLIVGIYLDSATRKTRESVFKQFKEYIELGGIITKQESTNPEPYVATNDGQDGLIWRYKKTCPNCKTILDSCYCNDILYYPTKEDFESDYPCGECWEESIIRYLMDEFNEHFTSDQCSYATEGIFEQFEEEAKNTLREKKRLILPYNLLYTIIDVDECILDMKTIKNKEDAKKLLSIIMEDYYDYGDPPDDMCSCQGF